MENFLWVFYLIVLLAATSCALEEGAASEEVTSEAQENMATNPPEEDHITIANQGGESGASGSTIYVTLPPEDQAPEVGSMAPSSTMPSVATEAVQPSSSPQVSSTTQATTKPPAAPQASANEIPPQKDEGKPMATSKSSHEKASAMESGAFPTTSSLPILVGVVALTLLVQS